MLPLNVFPGTEFGRCVALHRISGTNGDWHDFDCDKTLHFTCETSRSDYKKPSKPENTTCNPGWTYVQGNCYKVGISYWFSSITSVMVSS